MCSSGVGRGICICCSNYFHTDWQKLLELQACSMVLLSVGTRFILESPRFLAARGRTDEAGLWWERKRRARGDSLTMDIMDWYWFFDFPSRVSTYIYISVYQKFHFHKLLQLLPFSSGWQGNFGKLYNLFQHRSRRLPLEFSKIIHRLAAPMFEASIRDASQYKIPRFNQYQHNLQICSTRGCASASRHPPKQW